MRFVRQSVGWLRRGHPWLGEGSSARARLMLCHCFRQRLHRGPATASGSAVTGSKSRIGIRVHGLIFDKMATFCNGGFVWSVSLFGARA